MTLLERLAQLPDTALVPVAWVRELLAAENGAPGSPTRDDLARVRPGTPSDASTNGNELLVARDVAKRLGCSVRYVYAHANDWPFTVRLDGRVVRFDAEGLTRWMRRAT